ncbi:DNA mismatch repair protein MutT [Vibrio sp. MACH09]|uniref:NUDIX hydrolase n=1 Tax=Vibrio sp. MACH09 TaxID=3025122 RepID=UPI0027900EC0|nr:NUDIX domain-containing protein [Vibrio sp. MACH09]GLO63244.1 DNA mismatch repair protein MutT [Vibrio sp. MACH09]
MEVHECVSFILLKDDNVLLEKRSEYKRTDPGLINIPGGHMDEGETQRQTLCREVKEELNVVPTQYQYLCSLYHPTSELQLIHYYIVDQWQGEITAQEAEDVQWFKLASVQLAIEADNIALAEVARVSRYL